MRKNIALFTAAMFAGSMLGCTAAKEVYHTARGPEGQVLEVRDVGSLSTYDSFEVGFFQNELEGVAPPALITLIRDKIYSRVKNETSLRTEGKQTLIIRGKIVHVQLKSLSGALVSPTEEVVCHVEIITKEGQSLGWATVAGIIESRVRGASETGTEVDVADGVGKGVVSWLVSNGVLRVQN